MGDDVKTDAEWKTMLAHLDKFHQRGSLGEWKPGVIETPDGWAFRILCDGETVLGCGHVLADDVERCRDAANSMGLAAMSVNSLPFLVAEVRRLRAALAKAQDVPFSA